MVPKVRTRYGVGGRVRDPQIDSQSEFGTAPTLQREVSSTPKMAKMAKMAKMTFFTIKSKKQ